LLSREPAVVEAVEVPALELAAEDGGDRLDRRAHEEDGLMVRKPVQSARVGQVLEDSVVVDVA